VNEKKKRSIVGFSLKIKRREEGLENRKIFH